MSITEPKFSAAMGAPCQMRNQGQFPVWCVTGLDHTQILFSNVSGTPRQWTITGGTVYQQRFWASSTATIHLTCSLPTVHDIPPDFPLYKQKLTPELSVPVDTENPGVNTYLQQKAEDQDQNSPSPQQAEQEELEAAAQEVTLKFQPESEISIWAGYLPVMRPITVEDIENSKLIRIFVGLVDTVSTVGTAKGVTATIQCRDRIRYLQDTQVSFDPSYSDSSSRVIEQAFGLGKDSILRSTLIIKTAQLGIGYVSNEQEVCNVNGRIIKRGYVQDLGMYLSQSESYTPTGDFEPLPVGQGLLVGISGNTGKSTGPHLHIQYGPGDPNFRKEPQRKHLARLFSNGANVTSLRVSSGFGWRRGGMHYGIDYPVPIGQKLTTNVPFRNISLNYQQGKAGHYVTIYYVDGVVLQIFHLDNSTVRYKNQIYNGVNSNPAKPAEQPPSTPPPRPETSDRTAVTSGLHPNLRAVLDMIAWIEGTSTVASSDNGYNVMIGSRLFRSYAQHPGRSAYLRQVDSDASGRYQFLSSTWRRLAARHGYNDFGPINQDKGAIQLIRGRGAYEDVLAGNWPKVLDKISCEWASIPRSNGRGCHPGQVRATPQKLYDFLDAHLRGENKTGTAVLQSEGVVGTGDVLEDLNGKLVPIDFFYRCKNDFSSGVIPVRARTNNPKELLDIKPTIFFNIITGRVPFSVDVISKDFTIEEQIPVEFIRFLAAQEPYPTELFQNHLDGNLYYTPRVNDISGLADSKRFYRTYYYRVIPGNVSTDVPNPSFKSVSFDLPLSEKEDLVCETISNFDYKSIFAEVDYNQMLINFKEEQSTLGMKTNFFVANQSPNGTTAGKVLLMHMAARPAFLRGVEIGGRNLYIEDPTIKNIGEAAAVAASAARLYAKELRAASCTVLGDPSLTAGELIQIINSPLYAKPLSTYIDEREAIKEYEAMTRAHYMSVLDVTRKGINDQNDQSAPLVGTYSSEDAPEGSERPDADHKLIGRTADFENKADEIYCSVTNQDSATVVEKEGQEWGDNQWRKSGFKKEPQSIWRIEGVRHTLNSGGQQGWTTELALLSPY